ncbi:MAG: tetratricopeptide repeat protein [Marinilabiliaceae bacterium]|nr:tetratricopeptide repeat protein [Marinilabiliaceae bacterium]
MQKIIIVLILSFISLSTILAQDENALVLIDEGVELHDNELYAEAIRKFEKALRIESRNLAAKYEMANSWYQLGNFDKSAELSKQVVDAFGSYWSESVILYGSSLKQQGKKTKALRVYQMALKKDPGNQILRYHLGVIYFELKEYEKAEEHAKMSITLNKAHSLSHYLLSIVMLAQKKRVESMIALYYYLLLDQDSDLSKEAYKSLTAIWKGYAQASSVNVLMRKSNEETFFERVSATLLKNSRNYGEGVKDSSQFVEQTAFLLSLLSGTECDEDDFWDKNYLLFYKNIVDLQFSSAFAYYVSACNNKERVLVWVSNNSELFERFIEWMEEQ